MKYVGKHKLFDDLMIGGVLLTPPDNIYEYELTLPNDDGSAGQALTTDGNGLLTWSTIATGSGVTMTNGVDNRVMTATGATAITGEQYFTFDYSGSLGLTTRIIADPAVTNNQILRAEMSGSQTVGIHKGISVFAGKSGVTGSGNAYDIKGFQNSLTDTATNDANSDSYLWGVVNNLTHSNSTGDTKQVGLHQTLTGATTQYGIQNYLIGGTPGTMFGIWQNVQDGAMDLKFISSDTTTDDYFSIATGASGATTITTVDGGAAAANLDLNIDGQFSVASTGIDISGAGVITNAEWQGTDVAIAHGGTGQSTAQAAIDALTQVSGASTNQVLTKDGSGNATWATPAADTNTNLANTDLTQTGVRNFTTDDNILTFRSDSNAHSALFTLDGAGGELTFGWNHASSLITSYLFHSGTNNPDFRIYENQTHGSNYGKFTYAGALGGNRTYTLPDATGTVALTSDITNTTINGTTANGVGTYGGANTIDIETNLTFNGNILSIGGNTTPQSCAIVTPANSAGNGGDRLTLEVGTSGTGINVAAGQINMFSGLGTGAVPGGTYTFYGAPMANPAGGTGRSGVSELFQIFVQGGAASSSKTMLYDINNTRNHFTTEVKANGQTNLTTTDFSSHNADLVITADGAVDIISTDASNDIVLNSAGEIELNADGGNVDIKDDTNHFAKLDTDGSAGRLSLYGGSSGGRDQTGSIDFYEDTGYGTNHITLKTEYAAALSSDKTVQLPNETGVLALQNKGYKQNVILPQISSYTFYLYYKDSWYSANSSTLRAWGNTTFADYTLTGANAEYASRMCSFVATSACTVKSLTFTFYSYYAVGSTANLEFGFFKVPVVDGGTADVDLLSIAVSSSQNFTNTEYIQQQKTFTFTGANTTLSAGQGFAFMCRAYVNNASTTSQLRGQIYGNSTLEIEYN